MGDNGSGREHDYFGRALVVVMFSRQCSCLSGQVRRLFQ